MQVNVSNQIPKLLSTLTDELTNKLTKELQDVSKEMAQELNTKSPKRTGKYKKGWTVKKQKNSIIIHNKDKWRVTHLLEHGHAKRNGGRVDGVVHIEPIEQKAIKTVENKIDEFLSTIS